MRRVLNCLRAAATWMRRTLIIFAPFLLVACVNSYPKSETAGAITYPLPECERPAMELAGKQAAQSGVMSGNGAVLCRTKLMERPLETAETETESDENRRDAEEAFSPNEKALRGFVEGPFKKSDKPVFGLALSGGGTKAASFSVGVMAGLADYGLLDAADYISTVSGGGYAAYFYYTHRLFPIVRQGSREVPTNADLYRDCVDMAPDWLLHPKVIDQIKTVNHCNRLNLVSAKTASATQKAELIKYQAFLKCSQDVMRPGACNVATTRWNSGISKASAVGTIATAPASWIANILFDWGYTTSPSAITYRDGIGIGYGATVKNAASLRDPNWGDALCNESASTSIALDCMHNTIDPDPLPMTFEELKTGLLKMNQDPATRLPFWIINAAAPGYRSSYGWLVKTREDMKNSDMFEMTAVSHGSGRYGYVSAPVSIYDMSVLHAVAASAAFFDSSQLVVRNPVLKAGAGILQQVFNLNWGYDIPNYNVSTKRRTIHRMLPAGLYYADGKIASMFADDRDVPGADERNKPAFIRIIDGGNAENLGVYSLIKRGTPNIMISDAAQDISGMFEDICGLKNRLRYDTPDKYPQYLYVPGLADFDTHCKLKRSSTGYSVHHWRSEHPVLLGCVRFSEVAQGSTEPCKDLTEGEIRLFIVKPAIDLRLFAAEQLERTAVRSRVKACYTRGSGDNPRNFINCDSSMFLVANSQRSAFTSAPAERTTMLAGDICPIFPQHKTTWMTADSSTTLFVAYRELARQYVGSTAQLLREMITGDPRGPTNFEAIASLQGGTRAMTRVRPACPRIGPDIR